MARNLSRGLQRVFSGQALLYFLIGTIAVSVSGNAAYQFLTNITGTNKRAAGAIFTIAILILLWAAWRVERIISFGKQTSPLANRSRPIERRGLILLVSKEDTCQAAIKWHERKLEWCWLICSAQTKPLAEKLRTELEQQGKHAHTRVVDDAFDAVAVKEMVEQIYDDLPTGLKETDVILDFTGMPTPASVGSVLACLGEQRSIQYVPAEYDKRLDAVRPLDPVEIILSWPAIRTKATSGQTNAN